MIVKRVEFVFLSLLSVFIFVSLIRFVMSLYLIHLTAHSTIASRIIYCTRWSCVHL